MTLSLSLCHCNSLLRICTEYEFWAILETKGACLILQPRGIFNRRVPRPFPADDDGSSARSGPRKRRRRQPRPTINIEQGPFTQNSRPTSNISNYPPGRRALFSCPTSWSLSCVNVIYTLVIRGPAYSRPPNFSPPLQLPRLPPVSLFNFQRS